ncbi:MAG: phosphoribosyltransferase family protein [Chloroflexota bacterium]|nr:phosphoribosyltransferase family protein [Chloroflexota bacterium]
MATDTREQLIQLLDEHARVRGGSDAQFELASGEGSNVYFDGKRVTQSSTGIPLVGEVVWEFAAKIGADAVGGLAVGSIPISDAAVAYAALSAKAKLGGFYILDTAKGHGTRERVYQSFTEDGEDLLSEGTKVLIVDDVITTGGSIGRAIEEVRRRGADVEGVLVLIDRQDPRAQDIRTAAPHFCAIAELEEDGTLRPATGGRAAATIS